MGGQTCSDLVTNGGEEELERARGGETCCSLMVDEGEDWLMNFFGPCVNKCILQNIIIHSLYNTPIQ